MIHSDGLIVTIAVGLVLAFVGGFAATRLRVPPLVGYLLSGVVIGPFTPGFVANADIAHELAEIGVILLMFGVGIHFSLRDLRAVWSIALPGAIGQVVVATLLAGLIALSWGWNSGAALVLGLAISVASTVVLLRALAERSQVDTISGRIAIGWSVVQDLITVLVLVLLPGLAPVLGGAADGPAVNPLIELALALVRFAALGALTVLVGVRVIPWLLVQVIRTGSRELFTLAVLAVVLGIAVLSTMVFGVSLALGAFLAGVAVSESDLSHQAAADALPLRDAFAVLFFVSVGMLFDPSFLLAEPLKILQILAVIILGKGVTALLLVTVLKYPLSTGLTVAVGLAQVGEFSFILAELGRSLHMLPESGHSLILATAILSISINPWLFRSVGPLERWLRAQPGLIGLLDRNAKRLPLSADVDHAGLRGHAVLCGYGRVGRIVAEALERRDFTYLVLEQDYRRVEELRARGMIALYGDASNPSVLDHARLDHARVLIVAFEDPATSRMLVEQVRRLHPRLSIVARAHGREEWLHLLQHGVDDAVLGEVELAAEMVRFALHRFGVGGTELQAIVHGIRRRATVSASSDWP